MGASSQIGEGNSTTIKEFAGKRVNSLSDYLLRCLTRRFIPALLTIGRGANLVMKEMTFHREPGTEIAFPLRAERHASSTTLSAESHNESGTAPIFIRPR